MKICTKCKIEKELSEFYKDKKTKDLHTYLCKECSKESSKNYRENHREEDKEYSKNYRKKNPEKVKESVKKWKKNNPEKVKGHNKKYYKNNLEKVKESQKIYSLMPETKNIRNRYQKERKKTDINFKLSGSLRIRLSMAIKNNQKSGSAVRDLGCTIPELKAHLESLFETDMTWENWSTNGWHIDHIIPLSSFDLSNREEFLIACNYKNLQPLWAKDNRKKGNKIKEKQND